MLSLLSQFAEKRMRARVRGRWQTDRLVADRLGRVMAFDARALELPLDKSAPRSLPSWHEFVASGYSERMLFRYLLAMERCGGRDVLDACSGLGWGAYLVSAVAREVTGIDLDAASVAVAGQVWSESNLRFVAGSVLDLPFEDRSFDVVLCMESIEHFSRPQGEKYIQELRRVCRPNGFIVGSSTFPDTRVEARWMCRQNVHHAYIWTMRELDQLLRGCFGIPELITRHYFVARCQP